MDKLACVSPEKEYINITITWKENGPEIRLKYTSQQIVKLKKLCLKIIIFTIPFTKVNPIINT